jgi:hypothetical protein
MCQDVARQAKSSNSCKRCVYVTMKHTKKPGGIKHGTDDMCVDWKCRYAWSMRKSNSSNSNKTSKTLYMDRVTLIKLDMKSV